MINVLIDTNDLISAKKIINYIISGNEELHIVAISNNSEELTKYIKMYNIELIITTKVSSCYLIQEVIIGYSPYIIVISNSKSIESNKKTLCLKMDLNCGELALEVKKFIYNNLKTGKEEKATKILLDLGFNFKLVGTTYLLDAIIYVNSYKGAMSFERLEKDLYTYIAEKHNIDIKKVKWSITRTVDNMYKKYDNNNYHLIEKYFKMEYPKKPTPKLIIILISNLL